MQLMLGSTDFRGRSNKLAGSQLVASLPECHSPHTPLQVTYPYLLRVQGTISFNSLDPSPALSCPLQQLCLIFNPQILGPCITSRAWPCQEGKWREGKEGEGHEGDKMRKEEERGRVVLQLRATMKCTREAGGSIRDPQTHGLWGQ